MKEYNQKHLTRFRKSLRNDGTSTEASLWKVLKGRKLGVKFRRQFSIGSYIVDFYAPEIKLSIELDGGIHETYLNEFERTEYLKSKGIREIRFENLELFQSEELVIEEIKRNIKDLKKVSQMSPPSRGSARRARG